AFKLIFSKKALFFLIKKNGLKLVRQSLFSVVLPLSGLAFIRRDFHIRLLVLIYKKLVTLRVLFALRLVIGKQQKYKNVYGYVKPMPDFLEVRFCFHPNRVLLYRCVLFYSVASRSTFFS
ncbi:MAG: hypothetical protein ACLTHQ_02725, partial [Odoribacter splanchnicus]